MALRAVSSPPVLSAWTDESEAQDIQAVGIGKGGEEKWSARRQGRDCEDGGVGTSNLEE